MASSAAAAAAAQAMMGECQSLAAAAAFGNPRFLRHLSADGSPSSSSPSSSGGSSSSATSSSIAEDPRWKSPLFDALLSLAARASLPSSPPTSSASTAPSKTSTSSALPLPPPLRSVVAERHGLFDFLLDGARTAQARVLAHFIRSNVEASFDDAEFLEGAADARHAVFDALSGGGDLAPLRGAVAPGLLRALHGLKEMHAAAGLAVRMTATEDGDGGAGGRAELGVMGLLDPPLFEAMSNAVPGFEDLPSISRELEEKMAASESESGGGSDEGGSSSSSSGGGGGADASSDAAGTPPTPKSKLALSALDVSSFANAVEAAKSKSGVFSGRYQVLAVRFTGSVLVQTFAKSISASSSSSVTEEKGKQEEEKASVAAASSKAAAGSSPPPATPQSKSTTTLTLVRELLDKRPHSWRFVRGPLPEGLPVRQLGLPWTLLSIDMD